MPLSKGDPEAKRGCTAKVSPTWGTPTLDAPAGQAPREIHLWGLLWGLSVNLGINQWHPYIRSSALTALKSLLHRRFDGYQELSSHMLKTHFPITTDQRVGGSNPSGRAK